MRQKEIIEDIQRTIKEECSNPADYDNYVDLCLLYDPKAMAEYYGQTVSQIKYLCKRALMSI